MTACRYDDMHRLTGRSYSKASGSPTYPASQGPDSFAYDRTGRMTNADRDYSSPYTKIELTLAYDKANRVFSLPPFNRPASAV